MELNKYQEGALETAQYPNNFTINDTYSQSIGDLQVTGVFNPTNFVYPALGLVGEAGEVADKCKKLIRDKGGDWDDSDAEAIKKELGDVLWYVAVLANEFNITLEDVATTNYNKLASRKERGAIKGSGDDR